MSTTEELRAMLDERGVEWRERKWGGKHSVTTFWRARGVRWHYRENRFGEVRLHADGLTPEQAIAATLGAGTCKLPEVCVDHGSIEYSGVTEWRKCSKCGFEVLAYPPRFCPNCGRRVMEVDE